MMKTSTLAKTFRITGEMNDWLVFLSRENHITLTEALRRTIQMAQRYRHERQLERELLQIAADKESLRDDVDWADQNLD